MADVLVVGAGMSGLVGAGVLHRAGHDVVLVDKGRHPGGRMASRRTPHDGDRATTPVWDHGAQFVTLREDALAAETQRWRDQGWIVPWFRGSPDAGDRSGPGSRDDAGTGHPRFRGAPTMRGLPEGLASELPAIHQQVRVTSLVHAAGRWAAQDESGTRFVADAVLVTAPAPQALALVEDTPLPDPVRAELARVTFDPCLAVLAVPAGPTRLPAPGVVRFPPGSHDILQFLADNQRKGCSPVPSVTIHATGEFSREALDGDRAAAAEVVLAAAVQLLGVPARTVAVHGWRYSVPTSTPGDLAPGGTSPGPIRFAGDAFAGGRVEGAALSGWTAGHRLLDDLA